MWEIYTFGDVDTMNKVFNAISVMFQDGGFKAAGVAIALFIVIAQSMSSLTDGAKELPYGKLIAGFLLFSMGFQTLVSVSIEDRYSGTVTQIDNVPAAIAVPSSLISGVGFGWLKIQRRLLAMSMQLSESQQMVTCPV